MDYLKSHPALKQESQPLTVDQSAWPVRITTGIRLRKYAYEIVATLQEGTDWIEIMKGLDLQKYFHKPPSITIFIIRRACGLPNPYGLASYFVAGWLRFFYQSLLHRHNFGSS